MNPLEKEIKKLPDFHIFEHKSYKGMCLSMEIHLKYKDRVVWVDFTYSDRIQNSVDVDKEKIYSQLRKELYQRMLYDMFTGRARQMLQTSELNKAISEYNKNPKTSAEFDRKEFKKQIKDFLKNLDNE